MRKTRRLRFRNPRLFTQENLGIAVRLASFVGHALKATPYAKHAEPILSVTNAAREAFSVKREATRTDNLAQQNLRLQITALTSRLAILDSNSEEYTQISAQLETVLNGLTPSVSN